MSNIVDVYVRENKNLKFLVSINADCLDSWISTHIRELEFNYENGYSKILEKPDFVFIEKNIVYNTQDYVNVGLIHSEILSKV